MAIQVAPPPVKADKPQHVEPPRNEKTDDQFEAVYVGMLVAVALAVLALFRRRMPV